MKKTHPVTIATLGLVGVALGWLLQVGLVAAGRAALVPPISYAAVLVVFAVAIVAVAVPVRRVAKGKPDELGRRPKIDPFYATRVLALAKAAAITGAFLTGGTLALLVHLVTRPVVNSGSLLPAILGVVASAAVLVAGIVAEEMCRIPPGEKGDEEPELPVAEEH